jgi:sortase (surface protein transpeptidase)
MSWLTRLLGNGRRRLPASAAAVLLIAAAGMLAAAVSDQHHAPQPAASAALPGGGAPGATTGGGPPSTSGTPATTPKHAAPPAPASSAAPATAPAVPAATPTAISIPAIGVHHALLSLGLNPDGTLEVPPMSDVASPGWYRNSPVPGQPGPAVILGHIDGTTGAKGVFYGLGALRPGDTVNITRSDGTVAVFRIDGVDKYAKDAFPTLTVYGNTAGAQLRLITCGGRFDHQSRHYLDNIVVFATLTGTHPA